MLNRSHLHIEGQESGDLLVFTDEIQAIVKDLKAKATYIYLKDGNMIELSLSVADDLMTKVCKQSGGHDHQ